ncbi:PH domain-containing protein [Bifidobacterium felsineum]|uniref:PH domain-containing protein n=1 Tax=Bifidobacterium felsineum TaxID=2045440 RepID=UPI001BDCDDCB|nr:PH domain-containing protein [Bifidobacterium felsineum]MBT1164369.1 PH domain-containing protein [Bifidobacterium felsineum]
MDDHHTVRPALHGDQSGTGSQETTAFADGSSDSVVNGNNETASHATTNQDWHPLPSRVRTVWLINESIQCIIWLAVCAVVAAICMANDWWGFWQRLIVTLAAAYSILDLASQPLQTKYLYAFTRFRIGERDLATRKGWLFRRSTTTPYTRVQHVDTKQNPVQRHFGLTTVVVHTAADEHEIAALDTVQAERLVSLITERVAAAKDDL